MEVSFRCKRSGNIVRFNNPDDIAGLRKHEGYEEVTENAVRKEEGQATAKEIIKANKKPIKITI